MTTDQPSRQQRRRELKALLAAGRQAIARGVPNPAPQLLLVGIGLTLAEPMRKAGGGGAAEAAGLAIRLATGMIDTAAAKDKPACHKGCDHCCHFAISATAPEIFHLARALRSGGAGTAPIIDRLADRRRDTSGMALDALMAEALPCPMLENGMCGAYAARPIVCRQFMSRSAEACASARAGSAVEIPTLRTTVNAGVLARNLLLAAVRALHRDDRCYEVTSALAIALEQPDAERRWLTGEDLFAGALLVPRPPEANAMVDHLAAAIRSIGG